LHKSSLKKPSLMRPDLNRENHQKTLVVQNIYEYKKTTINKTNKCNVDKHVAITVHCSSLKII